VSQSTPRDAAAPGREPSSTTSASRARRWKMARPSGAFRLRVRLRLLRPRSGMPMPMGSVGEQTASTSIPRSASSMEQNGPGSCRDRSSIRNRESAPGMIPFEYYDRAYRDNLPGVPVRAELSHSPRQAKPLMQVHRQTEDASTKRHAPPERLDSSHVALCDKSKTSESALGG